MPERTYAELKADLQEVLADLAAIADERDSSEVARVASDLYKKVAEERFNAVVVGEFKRGKTTFVNALLGAEALPAAVIPLTSIVTAVAWGEVSRAEVRYRDGRVTEVPVGELSRYVTERENPRNHLGVDRATLHWPAQELRDGIFVVDTPGVGSVYRHNTDAAYASVPEVDAAVFLTSADPPISDEELRFLRDVRAEAARMFFILNKIDYLTEADRIEAEEFTRDVLRDALGRDVRLYPVSARRALDAKLARDPEALEASGLASFERDFRRFLLDDRGWAVAASAAARARKLAQDELNSVEVEMRSLRAPVEELARRAEEMERIFAEAEMARSDVEALVAKETERLLARVEEDLRALAARETPALLAEAQRLLAEVDDPRKAGEGIDIQVKESLRRRIDMWRTAEDRTVAEEFRRAAARFTADVDRLVARTVRLCAELLDVDLEPVSAPVALPPRPRFTYSLLEVPSILESILPDVRRVLPREVVRNRLIKDLRRRIPVLVEKHCGRLRWDFQQRLDQARRELQGELDSRLESTIGGLRIGVQRASEERGRTKEGLEEALRRSTALRDRVTGIEERFGALLAEAERRGAP